MLAAARQYVGEMTASQHIAEICRQIAAFPLEYRFDFESNACHPAHLVQPSQKLDSSPQRPLIFFRASPSARVSLRFLKSQHEASG
jgi:hypothetical protein